MLCLVVARRGQPLVGREQGEQVGHQPLLLGGKKIMLKISISILNMELQHGHALNWNCGWKKVQLKIGLDKLIDLFYIRDGGVDCLAGFPINRYSSVSKFLSYEAKRSLTIPIDA